MGTEPEVESVRCGIVGVWDPGMEADHSLPRHSAGSTGVVGVRARCQEAFSCFVPSVCDSRLFLASQNGNTKTKAFFLVLRAALLLRLRQVLVRYLHSGGGIRGGSFPGPTRGGLVAHVVW